MAELYTLFNHTLTDLQIKDARNSLQIEKIIDPPETIKNLWSNIPADLEDIREFLKPVFEYLQNIPKNNYILIQGDFGAVYLAVNLAKEVGLIPIYSTTRREHKEIHKPDGSVEMVKVFKHCIFRKY